MPNNSIVVTLIYLCAKRLEEESIKKIKQVGACHCSYPALILKVVHYDLDTIVGFCLCPCLTPSNHIIPISMHQDTKSLERQAITASWNRSKNTKRKLCTRSLKINVSVEHLHQHSLYQSFHVKINLPLTFPKIDWIKSRCMAGSTDLNRIWYHFVLIMSVLNH